MFTDSYFIVLCPPKEEIILQSTSVLSGMPALSPSTTIGEHCKDTSYNFWRQISIDSEIFYDSKEDQKLLHIDYNKRGIGIDSESMQTS